MRGTRSVVSIRRGRPAHRTHISRYMRSTTMKPSEPSEKTHQDSTRLLTDEEMDWVARLGPILQGKGYINLIRSDLLEAQKEGLDVVKIYTAAVECRPEWWPAAPA